MSMLSKNVCINLMIGAFCIATNLNLFGNPATATSVLPTDFFGYLSSHGKAPLFLCEEALGHTILAKYFSGSVQRIPRLRNRDEILRRYSGELRSQEPGSEREALIRLIGEINDYYTTLENVTPAEKEAFIDIVEFNYDITELLRPRQPC